jgi:hypothetical protein
MTTKLMNQQVPELLKTNIGIEVLAYSGHFHLIVREGESPFTGWKRFLNPFFSQKYFSCQIYDKRNRSTYNIGRDLFQRIIAIRNRC